MCVGMMLEGLGEREGVARLTEGGEEVEEEVIKRPESNSSSKGAGRVHRPSSVRALGEDTGDNREADGEGRGVLGGARLVHGRGKDGEDEEEGADELKEEDLVKGLGIRAQVRTRRKVQINSGQKPTSLRVRKLQGENTASL
jgi:hypothetical protein